MYNLFFEKEDYMFFAQYIEIPYRHLARIYLRKNDTENTLRCLAEAARFATIFDSYDFEAEQESLIARGNVPGGVWRHDTHNRSYDLLKWMQTDEIFNNICETDRFVNIAESLKKTAE